MPLRYYLLALCVAGIHALATAADYDADRAAGHRTLAVVYGRRTAAAFALATFVIALLFGGYQGVAVRVFLTAGTLATLLAAAVPRDRPIAAYCEVGQRGYLATRILMQNGFNASNVGGGFKTFKLFVP